MATRLLELREKFFRFVGRREKLVMAAVRFVIAFFAFFLINESIGYMSQISHVWVAFLLAALCAFVPAGVMVFVGAALILAQFYALAQELCLITLLLFILMFCLYFRFTRRVGYYAMLTPILCFLRIPYVMPVSVGLLGKPYNVISVLCGTVVYFLIKNVKENEALFHSFQETVTGPTKYTLAVNQIFVNKEMFLYIVAFVAAAITVYCIRRMKTDHAWTNATIVGIIVQLGVIAGGEVSLGNLRQLIWIFVGGAISWVLSWTIQMMTHSLDYSRVENVQFEDDEYYYYVKAVPKATVEIEDKRIKKISAKDRRTARSLNRGKKVNEIHVSSKAEVKKAAEDELAKKAMEEFDVDDDWME